MIERNPKICLIDDNAEDREVCKRYLAQDTDYTYHIFEADCAKQGLDLCRKIQPDCVLLDDDLPDSRGLDVLSQFAMENGSLISAVIVLVSVEDEAMALDAMKKGAQDYLVKTEMTPGNLFRAIHQSIERTAMRSTVARQQRDLEQRNQALRSFAYALAHDMRAPLRAINGFSQIIVEDYFQTISPEVQHYVTGIVQAGRQMDQIIEGLLHYTRIEHQPVRRRSVELSYLLRQISGELTGRLREMQATLTIAPDLPRVYGDLTLLRQVFTNLISNALIYHRPDLPPQVIIQWQPQDEYALLRVIDNGIGIAPKYTEKIFQLFQRLHGEDEYPGSGIGLAIVKKAVELMDGQIWVESEPGRGSTFLLKLPLAP